MQAGVFMRVFDMRFGKQLSQQNHNKYAQGFGSTIIKDA